MRIAWWGRRQRQVGSVFQHLPLLRRKLAETSRLNLALPRVWWHCPQTLDCILHCLAALRRQAVVLRSEVTELISLLRLQVFPYFSTVKHLLLPLRRQTVEVLQPLHVLLLTLRRQMLELRIILQRTPLLIERLIAMLVQPLTEMMALRRRLVIPEIALTCLRRWNLWPRLIPLPRS